MALFDPQWKSKNEQRAVAAVAKLKDPQQLYRAALEADCRNARRAAAERINDQTLLAALARSCKDESVYAVAIQKLDDPALLLEVACNAKSIKAEVAAVEKMDDPVLLLEVALHSKIRDTANAAAEKLSDPTLLFQVACDAESALAAQTAAERLTDPALLTAVIDRTKHGEARWCAQKTLFWKGQLEDYALVDVARRISRCDALLHAANAVTDKKCLIGAFNSARYRDEVRKAVARITDPEVLTALCGSDSDFLNLVIPKISDESWLLRFALHAASNQALELARERLNELGPSDETLDALLQTLLGPSLDSEVKSSAAGFIRQLYRSSGSARVKSKLAAANGRKYEYHYNSRAICPANHVDEDKTAIFSICGD